MTPRLILPCLVALAVAGCSPKKAEPVRAGADVLLSGRFDLVKGKKVGLVTNHSAMLSDGRHLADALHANPDVDLVALFGPEHGIRGDAPDGTTVRDGVDQATGAPVYSLYGTIHKPTPEMLHDVEVLVYDIQDVGARFYTYISTLSYAMEAAAEEMIPFVVLDRPNPIRGTWVEGWVRDDSLSSFVGLHPVPIAHGMTVGELARLFNGEGWLANGVKADLAVVAMENWERSMWYDQTGLVWVRPSPNMATLKTATVYPGTCLIEGTNLSEGRGTDRPFEYLGAPFVDGVRWADRLNAAGLPGVLFEPVTFVPHAIAGVTTRPKHLETECSGILVNVTDRDRFEPVRTGVHILAAAKVLFADSLKWRDRSIDRLAGTARLRHQIDAGLGAEEIVSGWNDQVIRFLEIRKPYLIY